MLKHNQTYSYKFYSYLLTDSKYDELAIVCDDYVRLKNLVSEVIYNEYYHNCMLASKSKNLSGCAKYFAKDMRVRFSEEKRRNDYRINLTESMIDRLYEDVFIDYVKMLKQKTFELSFSYKGEFDHFEVYKKNTTTHKKGDYRGIVYMIHKDESGNPLHPFAIKLGNVMTYLCRYGTEDIIDYIKDVYESSEDERKLLYDDILYCINKFGLERLLSLAKSKRDRIVRKINYHSMSFKANCRLEEIISPNRNKHSKIDAFVSLSWFNKKKLLIPVKYSKKFYGDYSLYNIKKKNFRYTVKLDEVSRSVIVILTQQKDRFYVDANETYTDVVGIDVNYKHNMFTIYDGEQYYTVDYDRELLKAYAEELKKTDYLKKKYKNYKIGKRRSQKLEHLSNEMLASERETIVDVCKLLTSKNKHHVAFENLNGSFGKCFSKDETFENINYNRLINFLHMSSLKDEFEHIALHYAICVSYVHSAYTSQQCPICGCIDKENRKQQENFECIDCQHSANADENAAYNIRNRIVQAVLRTSLLQASSKTKGSGCFEPKPMKRDKVKEILLKNFESAYC